MANAKQDGNGRPTAICASNTNGTTIVPLKADPITHRLKVSDGTTGSNNGNNGNNAMLDQNGVAVWIALSSATTDAFVEVYADPITGAVLINI